MHGVSRIRQACKPSWRGLMCLSGGLILLLALDHYLCSVQQLPRLSLLLIGANLRPLHLDVELPQPLSSQGSTGRRRQVRHVSSNSEFLRQQDLLEAGNDGSQTPKNANSSSFVKTFFLCVFTMGVGLGRMTALSMLVERRFAVTMMVAGVQCPKPAQWRRPGGDVARVWKFSRPPKNS